MLGKLSLPYAEMIKGLWYAIMVIIEITSKFQKKSPTLLEASGRKHTLYSQSKYKSGEYIGKRQKAKIRSMHCPYSFLCGLFTSLQQKGWYGKYYASMGWALLAWILSL